ncbi:acyl carrier protein [Cellulophaga phage Nekkels_1]|uniref:Acyl carrier protein n=1 Tax=Cellulophaga phage Nekkels_1 TaxID=2745692 RepID=A0A8E4UXI8_9CAUD|nr:acyl carrier protein [Cellulophaga phage Nekkels_1]QQO97072.1 acyl carrier protein [Cellulophaga phage Nekkels_1]QQO97168.1 acyl carrier protein [Cellulophaga phage Nekkels_2]
MIEEQIKDFKKYLADKLGFKYKDIKNDSDLYIDLHVDSLDFIEIIMDSEIKFNINIIDKEAYQCDTVADFIELIKNSKKVNK